MVKQQGLRDWLVKWLSMVIENGEPYDDFDNYEIPSEFVAGYYELTDQVLEAVLKQLEPYRHYFGGCVCGYVRDGDIVISWKALRKELDARPDKG